MTASTLNERARCLRQCAPPDYGYGYDVRGDTFHCQHGRIWWCWTDTGWSWDRRRSWLVVHRWQFWLHRRCTAAIEDRRNNTS